MKQSQLNCLPEQLKSGNLTEQQVIQKICTFVIKNYPLFGKSMYDEDFRQDILLHIVEKGSHILKLFNPQLGDFFTFFYCYMCTLINSKHKENASKKIKEKFDIDESILQEEERQLKYTRIDYKNFDLPKAPFAYKKMNPDELHKMVQELSLDHNEKKIIILALKSSYYLTDEQIQKICNIYKIDKDVFYNLIQHCKNTLSPKAEKHVNAEKRRNYAYYHYKRYSTLVQQLEDNNNPASYKFFKDKMLQKECKHRNNWNKLNKNFEQGYLYLRPSTKTVADIMGICERQVNYYMKCARNESEIRKKKMKDKDKSLEEN